MLPKNSQVRGPGQAKVRSFPLAADSRYVYAVLAGAQLFAFDAKTGEIAWSMATSDAGGEYSTSGVDSDRIYIAGIHGLYALRKEK